MARWAMFWPQGPSGASLVRSVAIATGVLLATLLVLWRRAEYDADREAAHVIGSTEQVALALQRLDRIVGGGWSLVRPAVVSVSRDWTCVDEFRGVTRMPEMGTNWLAPTLLWPL